MLDHSGERVRYKATIVESLFRAGRGEPMPWALAVPPVVAIDQLRLSADARAAAEKGFRDLIAESLVDPDLFSHVAQFIWQGQMRSTFEMGDGTADFGPEMVRVLTESSIRLGPSLLDEYESLLDSNDREESYQEFLARNPVFLDPLSNRVVAKQRLGLEYATDYAVHRLDGRWLLVEIEKPQDAIFTKGYDFSARFTHAFGQVLDFQHWVDENVAYAQRHMAGITSPRGLLVIGMRSRLDARATAKLRRFVDNSSRIDVVTFDDLLAGARNLYGNLHRD